MRTPGKAETAIGLPCFPINYLIIHKYFVSMDINFLDVFFSLDQQFQFILSHESRNRQLYTELTRLCNRPLDSNIKELSKLLDFCVTKLLQNGFIGGVKVHLKQTLS